MPKFCEFFEKLKSIYERLIFKDERCHHFVSLNEPQFGAVFCALFA